MNLSEAKQVLRNHGWRQDDLADFLGYTQAMVSMLLSGKANSRKPEAIKKILILSQICREMDEMAKKILGRYKIRWWSSLTVSFLSTLKIQ